MKRITSFAICLLLILPAAIFASPASLIKENTRDTSSNNLVSKSLILQGNLSAFNAAYGRNYFELAWNTEAGNFDRFEVERSLDGQKFETIGTVTSQAVMTTESQFRFRDHFSTSTALNNDFYYRLKQIDANGNSVYSKVLIARMYNTRTLASLSVTPDPMANDILVNVQLHADSYVMVKVTDENGNLVLKEGQKAANGANTYTLEGTHNLRPGMYTLEVTVNSKERMTMKLMKG